MFFIFLAVCWACDWLFEHNQPYLAILCALLFAGFYFIDRWMDQRAAEKGIEDEDSGGGLL